ncbi:hypothetical protein D9M68_646050 [compost metagenome]
MKVFGAFFIIYDEVNGIEVDFFYTEVLFSFFGGGSRCFLLKQLCITIAISVRINIKCGLININFPDRNAAGKQRKGMEGDF